MDDLAEGLDDFLKEMGEDLKIFPFQDTNGNDRIFLARFEFPKYGEYFQFSDAGKEDSCGFIDFLAGFPMDCIEMLVAIGEFSSKAQEGQDSKVSVDEGANKNHPTVPTGGLFKWPEKNKILLNLTALPTKYIAKFLAPNLEGESEPKTPKWWFRVQIRDATDVVEGEEMKFPVPGEFLGLGVRIWPGKYWGHQKSNPFVYAGNYMDTVYYSGARILEIIEPTDEVLYRTYKVSWHGKGKGDEEIIVKPSDFTEYKVGDRVALIKDVTTEKKTQLWKDDDMKFFGGSEDAETGEEDIVWQIAPISFYGLDKPAEAPEGE